MSKTAAFKAKLVRAARRRAILIEAERGNITDTPKYPAAIVRVDLTGPDGNAFVIMAKAAAMRAVGVPEVDIDAYRKEARSGDYERLLEVTHRWVDFTAELQH
jgi:hypothetical protein